MSRVGAVAIGRNEGQRLERCLTSLRTQVERIVYVDSGSRDGSVALARGLGLDVVLLDTSVPFTAARARNAGLEALLAQGNLDYVQFVDGDCGVEPGWIDAACATLDAHPDIGIVTGWRTEIDSTRNIYHAMCEVEWHRPAGDITSCGGDMMVRVNAFRQAGGFNPRLIASEDEEFCQRLAERTGLRVVRIPRIMTRHDIQMTRFSEWWRRHLRAGHGFAEVGGMYPMHFRRERLRAWGYGLLLPALAMVGLLTGQWWLAVLVGLLLAANILRTAAGLAGAGLSSGDARRQAIFLAISKLPNAQGMLTYYLRRLRRREFHLIEYK
ncbi:glycosyltransferase [Rubellimicrobium arenae]|uniref:glycosyltransferase n=1 Tax=Rubellimicrobium arenae TaxID=2817372 RepID=UPI001B30DD56|nr:glycosyltransferase family A protein [Rubellimicrobium arenae]